MPSSPCSALPRMIASSTSASTGTGGFYASFAMPAPEPPYSHNCAGYYSSRGLGKTMVLSAFIVVLLIGASYRGDPSADGPAKRSAQTISFAPSAGPGDINKLNKLTSTTKVGIFSGIDGLSFEMLDEMKKLDFKHWEDLRSTLGVYDSHGVDNLSSIKAVKLLGLVAELPPKLRPFFNGRTELCAVNWGRLRSLRARPNRVCP